MHSCYRPKNNFDEDVIIEERIDPREEEIDKYFSIIEECELEALIRNEPRCKRR